MLPEGKTKGSTAMSRPLMIIYATAEMLMSIVSFATNPEYVTRHFVVRGCLPVSAVMSHVAVELLMGGTACLILALFSCFGPGDGQRSPRRLADGDGAFTAQALPLCCVAYRLHAPMAL